MKSYSGDDIKKMIAFFDIRADDSVLVHSSLYMLGQMENCDKRDAASEISKILQEYLCAKGALLVPAFSYQFPKQGYFDLRETNSEMGILSNYILQVNGVLRSNHPMFSIAGLGHKAWKLLRPDKIENNPFGEDSTFDRLKYDNAVILILGAPLRVATFIVYCEYMLNIQYRFLKPFTGTLMQQNGLEVQDDFFHFCFPASKNYKHNYDVFHKDLVKKGLIKEFALGRGKVYSFRTKDFFNEVQQFLSKTPYGLLTEKPEAYYKYVEGEEVIVEKL